MADGTQITVAPATAKPAVNMVNLLRALGNPVRWEVLQLLATEGPLSVTVLAARTDRAQHSMSKHLQMLRAVGAVVMVAGTDGDGRKLFHTLPPGCLRDGANGKEIDYGVCVLRLG
jgi:DNA-binding transcriptional ArsR family regulator